MQDRAEEGAMGGRVAAFYDLYAHCEPREAASVVALPSLHGGGPTLSGRSALALVVALAHLGLPVRMQSTRQEKKT